MKSIIVLCKRVVDQSQPPAFDEGRLYFKNARYDINPADAYAIELALSLKSSLPGSTVEAVTLDDEGAVEGLVYAFARGVDKSTLLVNDAGLADQGSIARALAKYLGKCDGLRLIVCGDKTIEWGSGLIGPMVAQLLGFPLVNEIKKVEPGTDDRCLKAYRRAETNATEIIEVRLPCVFSLGRQNTEIKYASMRALEMAKRKKIEKFSVKDLMDSGAAGESPTPGVGLKWVSAPRPRPRKNLAIDCSLPPEVRFGILLSGGAGRKGSDYITGPADIVVSSIVELLREKEII